MSVLNKYILMTGAPGSKWSSVSRTLCVSSDIDSSDMSVERQYVANDRNYAMHAGAYWDPGMEFSNEFEDWDKPFKSFKDTKTRLIKSHTFSHKLTRLSKDYDYPIIMVFRNDFECMNQWFDAGGFNIKYPNYKSYYVNDKIMFQEIKSQNLYIMNFIQANRHRVVRVKNNMELADVCSVARPNAKNIYPCDSEGVHNYNKKDVQVYVYR